MTPFSSPAHRAFACALWFLAASPLAASEVASPGRPVRVWTTDDGLAQNWITALAQTSDGLLWAGSSTGLARFEGTAFHTFEPGELPGLPSMAIFRLFPDTRGRLWVETVDGGLYVSADARSFEPAQRGLPSLPQRKYFAGPHADGPASFDDDGRFLVYEDDAWRPWPAAESTAAESPATEGELRLSIDDPIVVDREARLYRWTIDGPRLLSRPDGTPLLGTYFATIDRHRMLFLSRENRLSRFVLDETSLEVRELSALRAPGSIARMYLDRADRLWLTLHQGGLARLDGERIEIVRADAPPGELLEDHEGSLWLATAGSGLWQVLPPTTFQTRGRAEGLLDDRVWTSLVTSDGTLWVGTHEGLTRHEPDGRRTLAALVGTAVFSLAQDPSGRLWVGTENGLWHGGTEGFEPLDLGDDPGTAGPTVRGSVLPTATGEVWVASHSGLFRVRAPAPGTTGETTVERVRLPSMTDRFGAERLRHLHLDRAGRLWMTTDGGALLRREGGRIERIELPGLGAFARAVWEDDEDLWVLTREHGLSRLGESGTVAVTEAHGLFDGTVHQVVPDSLGWLWMTSDRGVFRVRREALRRVADGEAASLESIAYGLDDGLRDVECNSGFPGVSVLPDGRFAIPTMSGLSLVDPARLRHNEVAPRVHLFAVRAGDRRVSPGESLRLAPAERDLEIEYAALTYRAPDRARYRYRLAGYDEGWVDADRRRTAVYTGLPPGRYVFAVEATNADGVWSERPTTLEIVAPARWSEQRVVQLAGLLLPALAAWRIGRWRLAHRHRLELEALVEERTRLLEEERRRTLERAEEIRELRVTLSADEIDVEPETEVFLRRVLEAIEANLHRSNFGVYELAEEVHLSRRQLHRKLVALSDETPAALLRRIRLERAAKLLEKGAGSVAEVAAAVGYTKPAHFSSRFKEVYGENPSTFRGNGSGSVTG